MDHINLHLNQQVDGFDVYGYEEQNHQNQQVQGNNVEGQNPNQIQIPGQRQQDPIKQHIQNIERQKRLAQQPANNVQQLNQQQQEQQDQPVPQELQNQAQQLAQQNMIMAQAQLHSAMMLNQFKKRKKDVTLDDPTADKLLAAYTKTGFEYASAQAKRDKMLREATTRRTLQGTLQNKIQQVRQHPPRVSNLTKAKAVSYSDKYIVSHYGEFGGEATLYLELRFSLMKNKYYALLPVAELKNLPRLDIMNRLTKEMKKEHPDHELVMFYQNLVELQNMEAEIKKKDVRSNPTNPPREITAKERKNNASYFKKLQETIHGNIALSGEAKAQRVQTMHDVMYNDGGRFWQDKKPAETKDLTPEKKEGIRSILAWMYRNCDKGNKSQEPIVNMIAHAKPNQVLHMLYLIENKMETAPTAESFYEATGDYIPNLKVFSDRANWTKISQVAGFVLKNQLIGSFLELDEQEENIRTSLEDNGANQLNDEQKDEARLNLIITKAHKIMRMYSAAGLEPNMPIQLIPSKTLRDKITAEVNGLVAMYNALSDQLQQRLNQEIGAPDEEPGDAGDKAVKLKNKKKVGTKNAQQHIGEGKTIAGHVMQANTLLKVIGDDVNFITKNTAYSLSTSGISGVLAIVGLISSIMSSVNLDKAKATMAGYDYVMKAMGQVGDYLGAASGISKATGDFIKFFSNIPSENLPWIGRTAPLTASESFSTIPGAISFCAGGVTVLSGIFQLTSNAMSARQANRSLDKLSDADNALTRFNQQTDNIQDQATKERRQIQSQQLRNLMDHRADLATKQRNSATVGIVGSILTMVGGALTMTGMLAPIGGILSIAGSIMNIGYGMIYAKKAKKASLKKAVDAGIKLDDLVTAVKQAHHIQNLSSKDEEKLRNQVRQEALAELGYSDYKAMYLGLCKDQAEMIYHHVFEAPTEDVDLNAACKDILLSLKFKEDQIHIAEHPYERNYPPLTLIYSRLTEGL